MSILEQLVSVETLKGVYDDLIAQIKGAEGAVTFKYAGTCKFAALPTPSVDVLGNVYNIEDDFVTTASFVEGADMSCTKGADVAVISLTDAESGETVYKFDLLNASADLQGYVSQVQLTKLSDEMHNYVKSITFQDDNTNTITVVLGDGRTSTYTLNVGKNADIVDDIPVDESISTNLGNIKHRRIVRDTEANTVSLMWEDPAETTDSDAWGKVIVIKKKGSYPTTLEDGTVVLVCAVKNRFKTTPYVDNQEDCANWYYKAFPISTNGGVGNSVLNNFDFWQYGFKIDETNAAEATSITYLEDCDNADYTPLKVEFNTNDFSASTLSWGSWENAPFMPKPCMLKYDGTVDYYLDPDDYTLRADGETASDVADTSYGGNAMMEWIPIFKKVYRDGNYLYVYFCSEKYDDDYECWSAKKSDGTYGNHFYTSIYECTLINGKWRSISTGALPSVNISNGLVSLLSYAAANGANGADYHYCVDTWADHDLIALLGMLVTRRLNAQDAIGWGCTSYNCCVTGTSNKKGMFWGSKSAQNTYATKFFGMENRWCHNWHYCAGIILSGTTILAKNTYSTIDNSTEVGYNTSGSGYVNTGLSIPSSNGYIKTIQGTSMVCVAPKAIGSSSTTYFCDYMYRGSTGCFIAGSGYDGDCCGFVVWDSNLSPSVSYVGCGGCLSYRSF